MALCPRGPPGAESVFASGATVPADPRDIDGGPELSTRHRSGIRASHDFSALHATREVFGAFHRAAHER